MALQERYSSLVEARLRAESVFAKLFNTNYEGTPTAGAVKIPVRAEATVGAYNVATGGTLSQPTTTFATLPINKDMYVNELIDGYEAAAVPDNMVADRLDSAGYALADQIDLDLITEITTDGTEDNGAAFTKSTIYDGVIDMVQQAKALKVKANEMWLAVPTTTYAVLSKAPEFISAAASQADLGNGFIGKIAGIPIFESANLDGKTMNGHNVEIVLGNKTYCHYVGEWAVEPGVKDLADGAHIGASAVQGRKVYGSTISKGATVIVKTN